MAQIGALRSVRPNLDLALTHVDDRFDTGMRDAIGADAAAGAAADRRERLHVSDRGSGPRVAPGAAAVS